MELLHSTIEDLLLPRTVLDHHPNKKLRLEIEGPNTWPNITMLPQNEHGFKEIRILVSEGLYFSYLLSSTGEISPLNGESTNFLNADRSIFPDKCRHIATSLSQAVSRDLNISWEATPSTLT